MLKSAPLARSQMKRLFPILALASLSFPLPTICASSARPTVIFDNKSTELSLSLPPALVSKVNNDLWMTLADLTRATGFEVKPQGVCRKELCFPLPSARKSEFLIKSGNTQWFNLSAFAQMLHQPVAHDDVLNIWYFGLRPEVQNNYLSSFQAPNFTLPDMDGKPHSLSDFRGKKVLIVTWASW
jgi:hypothetical protein